MVSLSLVHGPRYARSGISAQQLVRVVSTSFGRSYVVRVGLVVEAA